MRVGGLGSPGRGARQRAVGVGDGQPAGWSVDFWIADADAAAAAAPDLGGRVLEPPFQDANFRRTILAAPDGAAFGVSQLLLAH